MSGPLEGIRLIEIAGLGPAPFAGMMLSDMGAEIVRVGRPEPGVGGMPAALTESPVGNPIDRGRPTIRVDLRQPDGLGVVLRMIESADGLFEGFRPGVMERLGLGPDTCLERNRRLVYGRMTGWGQDGPMSQRAGHDITYLARIGALSMFARRGEIPSPPLNLAADYGGGGMLLAFGMVCGLLEAKGSGRGQVVDAAMTDGVAVQLGNVFGRRANGQWNDEPGTNHTDGGSHFYEVYRTRDQRHMAVGALEAKFYRAFVEGLGFTVEDMPQWDRDRWPELKEVVAGRFGQRTQAEWAELFDPIDACVAPVLPLDDAVADPHHRSRSVFVDVDGVTQPAPAPRFSRTPGTIHPAPDDDPVALLAAFGVPTADADRAVDDGIVS